MGLFSALFGGDDCNRLNTAKNTQQEYEDTVIEYTQHPDVRRAMLDDPTLTQEQRKTMYKINNAYKGVEGQQTYKDWEANYDRECREDMKRKSQNQEPEQERRGWFW